MHLLAALRWIFVVLWLEDAWVRLRNEGELAGKKNGIWALISFPGLVNRTGRRRGLENQRPRCKALVGPFLQFSRPDWSAQWPWESILHHFSFRWQVCHWLPHAVQFLPPIKPDYVLEVPNPDPAHILFKAACQWKSKKLLDDCQQGTRVAAAVLRSQKAGTSINEGIGFGQGCKGSCNACWWDWDYKESELWVYIGG